MSETVQDQIRQQTQKPALQSRTNRGTIWGAAGFLIAAASLATGGDPVVEEVTSNAEEILRAVGVVAGSAMNIYGAIESFKGRARAQAGIKPIRKISDLWR